MPFQASLVVRADAGPSSGVGHLARCLALTQAWTDRGGRAALVSASPPPDWAERFAEEGCAIVDPVGPWPVADWVAVDGYHLRVDELPPHDSRRLRIDDHGLSGRDAADLVVDQNVGASPALYPQAENVLAGSRYALLRRGLAERASGGADLGRRGPLLVSLGGSPTPGVRAFARSVLESDIVGPALADGLVEAWTDPGEVMSRTSLALAAGGTTCLELALFGVPMVLISVADNQVPVALALAERGAGVYLGAVPGVDTGVAARTLADLAGDHERRSQMARRGSALVDGLGSQRVVSRMYGALLRIRDAGEPDAELIYGWSNDPATRAASFSPEPISWSDHVTWLRDRLDDPGAVQLIASDPDGDAVGLVRFDCSSGEAVISVVVAPNRRGQGWGAPLIDAGFAELASRGLAMRVVARIRPANVASQRSFVAADFDVDPGIDDTHLQYTRWFDERRAGL